MTDTEWLDSVLVLAVVGVALLAAGSYVMRRAPKLALQVGRSRASPAVQTLILRVLGAVLVFSGGVFLLFAAIRVTARLFDS